MITLFGAPGAGKTMQGQLLVRKYGWQFVSYRQMLERIQDKDVRFALDHGMYVEEEKIIPVIKAELERLRRVPTRWSERIFGTGQSGEFPRRIILDGFPETYQQMKWLIETKEIGNLKGAIVIRVPRGELWRRLVKRKRVDDTRAAIERRQDAYERNVTGMIKALKMNNILVREVDGGNAPEDVLERIEGVLAEWGMVKGKEYEKIRR